MADKAGDGETLAEERAELRRTVDEGNEQADKQGGSRAGRAGKQADSQEGR